MASRSGFVTHGCHALIGSDFFTAYQGDINALTKVMLPIDLPNPSSLSLNGIWQLGWVSNEVPFAPLVPLYKPFYGTLFCRLAYNKRTIPVIKRSDGSWALEDRVVVEWDALERILRVLLSSMHHIIGPVFPKMFRYWSFPMRYGYKLSYNSFGAARFIALRSRDAFVPLMASLSLMLILMRWKESVSPNFVWRDEVLKKSGIHYQWLADLESSPVGDFDAPRVGGIIHWNNCDFKWMLPHMSRARNMPLYIRWGPANNIPLRFPAFLGGDMIPSSEIIAYLRSLAQKNARTPRGSQATPTSSDARLAPVSDNACPVSSSSNARPPPASNNARPLSSSSAHPPASNDVSIARPPPPRNFPPVEAGSGQLLGEDWRAFFARREAHDVEKAKKESPEQKERRMQRVEHAKHARVPGKKGATVYCWDDVDGFLVRRAAGRKNYNDIWGDYGPSQRRYDSFRDEWDLCEALGTHDEIDLDYEDECDYDVALVNDETDGPIGAYSSTADLERTHGETPHNPAADDVPQLAPHFEPPEDTAYYRFGFIQPSENTIQNAPRKIEWSEVCNLVGRYRDSTSWTVSQSLKDSLGYFFGYLSSANSTEHLPAYICDLQREDRLESAQVAIRREVLSNQTYYIISPKTGDGGFELLLKSAASVMEIVRSGWGPDVLSVAHKLFDRRIAFNLCSRAPPPLTKLLKLRPAYGGLGYRSEGYKPDRMDYIAYEATRNVFLRSPRGRAAMLEGGILARLASEVLSYDRVCYGPSDDVIEEGVCLWDSNKHSLGYWDDCLTDDEKDLICGVYRVDTGEISETCLVKQ